MEHAPEPGTAGEVVSPSGDEQALTTPGIPIIETSRPMREIGASLAPLLLASTAIAAALAFYMGWDYERAYVEEWGLPFSAFKYSPYDFMVASSTTLIFAILSGYVYLFVRFADDVLDFLFQTFGGSPWSRPAELPQYPRAFLRGLRVALALVFAFSIYQIVDALVRDQPRQLLYALGSTLGFIGLIAWPSYRAGSKPARVVMIIVALVAVYVVAVVAPERLGAADAKKDRDQPEDLPRVEFVLNRALGSEVEHTEGTGIISGPWRVIRVNDGRYWLVPDEEHATEVMQIDAADVESARYLPD